MASNPRFKAFSNKVFEEFEKHITGIVFEMIWENPELQRDYLDLIAASGAEGRLIVNRWLGKQVKDHYKLNSIAPIDEDPMSPQIKGHKMLKK